MKYMLRMAVQDLLHKQWQEETNSKGKKQFRCGSAMMLPSDMALLKDPSLKRYVLEFAEDENLWFSEFGKAWIRLQEAGCQELRDILWARFARFKRLCHGTIMPLSITLPSFGWVFTLIYDG